MTYRLPYFRTTERVSAMREQLRDWHATRWQHAGTRPNEMQCGIRGDCLFWVHVFKAIGALPTELRIPDYRKREAAMDNMARLQSCIMSSECAECVWRDETVVATLTVARASRPLNPMLKAGEPPAPLLPGDVLLFANGMSGVHCGLVVRESPPHFVHLSQNGLTEEPLNQAHWLKDLAFVYRLVESALNPEPRTVNRER